MRLNMARCRFKGCCNIRLYNSMRGITVTKHAPLSYHVGFNAQHSPMGAFMSFTCGNFGTRGGIGLQIGQPGDQEVFIGFKDGDRHSDATLKCLPFYTAAVNCAADAFLVEQAGPAEQNVRSEEHTSELQSLRHLVCRL